MESLEGRALMAGVATILDRGFGSAGVVRLGEGQWGTTAVAAVAVQDDGKVVQVGTVAGGDGMTPALSVRRFNADGTPDTKFGTGGRAAIPLPSGALRFQAAAEHVLIKDDGSIVLAATFATTPIAYDGGPSLAGVYQLTPSGQLDPNFGVGGQVINYGLYSTFDDLALQDDGRVVVLATRLGDAAGNPSQVNYAASRHFLMLLRLTTAGALDPTFGGDGVVDLAVPADQTAATLASQPPEYAPVGLAIAPSGQIYALGIAGVRPEPGPTIPTNDLTRVNSNGDIDTSYGTGGTLVVPGTEGNTTSPGTGPSISAHSIGVQPDNKVVIAGLGYDIYPNFLVRLDVGGELDPTFQANTPSGASPFAFAVRTNTMAVAQDGGIVLAGSSGSYLLTQRLLPDGAPDPGFGLGGRSTLILAPAPPTGNDPPARYIEHTPGALALTSSGDLIVGATIITDARSQESAVLAKLREARLAPVANDFDGDGRSDLAVYLPTLGRYIYRPSNGSPDITSGSIVEGPAQIIPGAGAFRGFGVSTVTPSFYEPESAALSRNGTNGGSTAPFGDPGVGNSIPALADYDGDGYTDPAVYLARLGVYAYRPSSGGPDVLQGFGLPGADASIPAPGDYDGDGKADIAAYLPTLGVLAYRPSSGGDDVLTSFGIPGNRMSIPAPGDYDGDGRTDIAAYLPTLGVLAYRPSAGGGDVLTPFGLPGAGASIPAPGDYDGDGKTDIAVYLPSLAVYAYRPSSGGGDVLQGFGIPGPGKTIPITSIPYAIPATVASSSLRGTPAAATGFTPLALTDDLLDSIAGVVAANARKKANARPA